MKIKSLLLSVALFGAFFASAFADVIPTGHPITLTATADGTTPFTYQWSKGTAVIPGATLATLDIPSFSAADVGLYSVKISNSAGSATASITLTQQILPPTNPKVTALDKFIAWVRSIWAKMFA